MTTDVRPQLHKPPGGSSDRDITPIGDAAAKLGLSSSTALVVGSIIGTGVFTMPAVLAGAGTSSIITLGVISVGALLLGVLFGQLTRRVPNNEGGLYAYARHEFGEFAGYLTAWCYWITCWAGNAAMARAISRTSPSRSSPAEARALSRRSSGMRRMTTRCSQTFPAASTTSATPR